MPKMSEHLCKYCNERKVINEVYAVCWQCKDIGGRKSIGDKIDSLGTTPVTQETPTLTRVNSEEYEYPQISKKKDSSWGVATVIMITFGIIGLGIGGLGGALLGAIFGFGVTAIVMGTQEWLK